MFFTVKHPSKPPSLNDSGLRSIQKFIRVSSWNENIVDTGLGRLTPNFGGEREIRTHGTFPFMFWQRDRDSNPGNLAVRKFSRLLVSATHSPLRCSYRCKKLFPYLVLTYSSIGCKSFSYKTFISLLASNFANHCSVLNPLTSVKLPCTIKSGM